MRERIAGTTRRAVLTASHPMGCWRRILLFALACGIVSSGMKCRQHPFEGISSLRGRAHSQGRDYLRWASNPVPMLPFQGNLPAKYCSPRSISLQDQSVLMEWMGLQMSGKRSRALDPVRHAAKVVARKARRSFQLREGAPAATRATERPCVGISLSTV